MKTNPVRRTRQLKITINKWAKCRNQKPRFARFYARYVGVGCKKKNKKLFIMVRGNLQVEEVKRYNPSTA